MVEEENPPPDPPEAQAVDSFFLAVADGDGRGAAAALRRVGKLSGFPLSFLADIAEHLELKITDADETITQLVAVLDTKELADAINRLERGFGLRVVK
jgi:hypothetical protein